MRILHLTDLHLFADPQERLMDVPTRQTFHDVLEHVRSHQADFDRLVVTGDLAHDERRETYFVLRDLLGDWTARGLFIPGNHDHRPSLQEAFPERTAFVGDALPFSSPAGNWQLIGLDSHVPGEVGGRLDNEQMFWLKRELGEHADRPTILFLHHPPYSVDTPWLDRIGLQNPEILTGLIDRAPQVRAVCCGHVHQEYRRRVGQAEFLTTPSTCAQFAPGTDDLVIDSRPPGYRVFDLGEEALQSEVVRLPSSEA